MWVNETLIDPIYRALSSGLLFARRTGEFETRCRTLIEKQKRSIEFPQAERSFRRRRHRGTVARTGRRLGTCPITGYI
jgi:hypothetical protein